MEEFVLPNTFYQALTMQEGVTVEANILYDVEYDETLNMYICTNTSHKTTVPVTINEQQQTATIILDNEINDEKKSGVREIWLMIHGGKTGGSEYTTYYNVGKELNSLRICEGPNKIHYLVGEHFEREGMIVEAIYSDGSRREIDDYIVLDGEDLKVGQETVTISYTENGITKTTKQNICVSSNLEEEVFNDDSTYFINEEKIIGINPNTSIVEFEGNVKTQFEVQVFKDNELITTGKIATGMIVVIKENGQEINRFTAIVKGDCNGDGMADVRDMVKINNYRLYGTTTNFSEIYQLAGDINSDDKIDVKDMIRINNYRLYGTSF